MLVIFEVHTQLQAYFIENWVQNSQQIYKFSKQILYT